MNAPAGVLPERLPVEGELVQVRSRRWLVEEVVMGEPSVVRLACAEDDAQGELIDVLWDYELDRRILEHEGWADLARSGFDDPRYFAAFLNTLRWNTVTATDASLFQSPFRAGIKIDAYQMEPLRKALRLPRVNLFIADDTGLGKTIEAGLIARELLLRKRAKQIVVAAPPSVLEQWKAELEERFGLLFEILDRSYVSRVRQERGFGVNPWLTHSRFLVSHNLLSDPVYADPMRAWLGQLQPGSLLILDEAHHAAPSSGGRYGIETKFTRAVRDLGARFEHRLFLSATPHNGHSNSFSTLLELLDPYRFTRGVKVRGRKVLEDVMVRRIKDDIRGLQGGFPDRKVVRLSIDGLPDDAPELVLSRLLDEYRGLRDERFADATGRRRAAAGLLVVGLQQRLLSSIEAFAQSLTVHRRAIDRREAAAAVDPQQLVIAPGPDDDRAEWSGEDLEREEAEAMTAVTAETEAASATTERERALLDRMQKVAEAHRHEPDAKARRLVEWIREHCVDGDRWTDTRVLIFTESREGTKRYLERVLEEAIAGTDRAEERIAVITGQTGGPQRKEIQRRFNTEPTDEPLRILLATDAAREGLNFQAHCADLFHFDLPWNPGRIEQRNGRIDRKLQPAPEVRCHYFVLPQRVEDRVLEVLVTKTETIKKELGSLSKVIDDDLERRLRGGIRHGDADRLAREIEDADLDAASRAVAEEELEEARTRRADLAEEIERCQTLLERSRRAAHFASAPFRDALSCSLELLGAEGLQPATDERGRPAFSFPDLSGDPSWTATLDTLRTPRPPTAKLAEWRREAPVRPVVFEDEGVLTEATVHLHLEQRVAQRLLSRFRSQGFVHHDLSRACLAQAEDSVARVLLLGRLSLYGRGAERLHEQLVAVTARWVDPERRDGPLVPYSRDAEARTLELLDLALEHRPAADLPQAVRVKLQTSAAADVEQLRPFLGERADEEGARADERLRARGDQESSALHDILVRQRDRVREELAKHDAQPDQLMLDFADEERRQREQDVRSWRRRLEQFDADLETEPQRISDFYVIRARRLEPVGLVYLWPDTN